MLLASVAFRYSHSAPHFIAPDQANSLSVWLRPPILEGCQRVQSELFEHFVCTAHATDHRGGKAIELWDEDDGCYYDALHYLDGRHVKMWVRSMAGLPCLPSRRWYRISSIGFQASNVGCSGLPTIGRISATT